VVQHISAFARGDDGGWSYSFTQEWPVPGLRHQLGYTLSWLRVPDGEGGETGFSDVALNYRFQAADGERMAFAPRVSLLFPTGDEEQGLGSGHAGVQANLPLSLSLSPRIVTHGNLGATWIPSTRNEAGEEADTFAVNLAGSLVWLARPRFNVLLEATHVEGEQVSGEGRTVEAASSFLSPGVRWAVDLDSGLQIVPGIAAPIGVGESSGDNAIFLYLSFEHPFGSP
jgi:hypothetical protein